MGAGDAGRTEPGSGRGGLVAVHAHPDDETLATGALLATWARSAPVTVVTCTRGEQGEVIGSELAHLAGDPAALAAHRDRELAAALAALGVGDHVFLDQVPTGDAAEAATRRYTDSGMVWAGTGRAAAAPSVGDDAFVGVDVEEAATRLAVVLADRRPLAVVCDEPGGGYGHPDHVHTHDVVMRAAELVDVPVLWAVVAEPALRAGYRAIAHRGGWAPLTAPDPDGPVPSRAVPARDVDLVVPVAPVLPQVLAAMRAHATQVQAVQTLPADDAAPGAPLAAFALSNGVVQPVLAQEEYRLATHRSAAPVRWPDGVVPRVA